MSETEFVAPEQEMELEAPAPLLWRVCVQPYKRSSVTEGGIALPEEYMDKTKYLTMVGKLVSRGTFAYQAQTTSGLNFSDEARAPQVGDWVLYGKYAGQRIVMKDGREFIIMNDDEIIAVIDDPESYIQYA